MCCVVILPKSLPVTWSRGAAAASSGCRTMAAAWTVAGSSNSPAVTARAASRLATIQDISAGAIYAEESSRCAAGGCVPRRWRCRRVRSAATGTRVRKGPAPRKEWFPWRTVAESILFRRPVRRTPALWRRPTRPVGDGGGGVGGGGGGRRVIITILLSSPGSGATACGVTTGGGSEGSLSWTARATTAWPPIGACGREDPRAEARSSRRGAGGDGGCDVPRRRRRRVKRDICVPTTRLRTEFCFSFPRPSDDLTVSSS